MAHHKPSFGITKSVSVHPGLPDSVFPNSVGRICQGPATTQKVYIPGYSMVFPAGGYNRGVDPEGGGGANISFCPPPPPPIIWTT